MTFDKKNIFTIGLAVSLGLNIILSFLVFQDKFLLKSTSMQKPVVSSQEQKKPEPTPTQETKPEREVKIEKEYEVLIPEVRKNDSSNDGWMTRKWNGVYSNPERKFFADAYVVPETPNPSPPDIEVNMSDPDSFVIFENDDLSLRIPFNEKWGEPLYKFEPFGIRDFDILGDTTEISFGKIAYSIPEGGRSYYLLHPVSLVKADTVASDIVQYIIELKEKGRSGWIGSSFKLKEISLLRNPQKRITVLEYIENGLGDQLALAFFEGKYIYTLVVHEFYHYSYDDLEDIVSTIEFK